jgi:putative membrane protein
MAELILAGGVGFVALQHVAFGVLEMFFWQAPLGLKAFRMKADFARASAALAANQGLYNLFLAGGLGLSFFQEGETQLPFRAYFLACAGVAGLYGGWTVNRRIFWIQGLPALALLVLLGLNNRG